jgi:hypothetical protein
MKFEQKIRSAKSNREFKEAVVDLLKIGDEGIVVVLFKLLKPRIRFFEDFAIITAINETVRQSENPSKHLLNIQKLVAESFANNTYPAPVTEKLLNSDAQRLKKEQESDKIAKELIIEKAILQIGKSAIPLLLKNLVEEPELSEFCSRVLSGMNLDDSQIQQIIYILENSNIEHIQKYLILSFSEKWDERAIPALSRILLFSSPKNRTIAAYELEQIGIDKLDIDTRTMCFVFSRDMNKIKQLGRAAMPGLFNTLNYSDRQTIEVVSKAMQIIGINKKDFSRLITLLKTGKNSERYNAAYVLGELKNPQAVSALAQAIDDPDPNVYENAIFALGKIGTKSAIETLINIIKDGGGSWQTVISLGTSGNPHAVPTLVELLKSNRHREGAVSALNANLEECTFQKKLTEFESKLQEGYSNLVRESGNKPDQSIMFEITKLKMAIAKKRNQLAQDKGILLDDKPKPPKRNKMYQQARRIRNG